MDITDIQEIAYGEQPPLMLAVMQNNYDQAQNLLKGGASTEITDLRGWTPLLRAASYQDVKMVKLLLYYGSNPETIDAHHNSFILQFHDPAIRRDIEKYIEDIKWESGENIKGNED